MKISDANDTVVERNGIASDGAYGIIFNAKMAKILSDGLYSDKIGSIIRELSCNAIDSHVDAGKRDMPIEVHLPTIFEPWFHVRDFGTGLDHHQVTNIFTCYGASTKTKSDDFIGQLGLGSKSPFSYVDAFDVTARKDGIERQYSMYKNEQGMPSVALMGEHPTTEPNGVCVKIPVKQDDMRRFSEKAAKVFRWFEVMPAVIGPNDFTVTSHEVSFEGKGWQVRKRLDSYYHSDDNRPVALMGRVAYPLDAGSLQNATGAHRSLLNIPVTLVFNIGDLEVAASREALGYDQRTQANIIKAMDDMIADMAKEFERRIAAAGTEWQARLMFDSIFGNEIGYRYELENIYGKAGLRWQGMLIKSAHVSITTKNIYDTAITPRIWTMSGGQKRLRQQTCHEEMLVRCNGRTVVVFDDLEKGGQSRLRYFYETSGSSKEIICFGYSSLKTVKEIVEMLGNPAYHLTSQMPKRPAGERQIIGMLEFRPGNEGSKAWQPVTVDVDDGGYYVMLDRYDVMHGEGQFGAGLFNGVITAARVLGIISATDSIYAPRGKLKKELGASTDWTDVLDHIKDEVNRRLTPAVMQAVADNNEFTLVKQMASDSSIWNTRMQLADPVGPFARFTAAMRDLEARDAAANKNQTLIKLAQAFGTNVTTGKPAVEVKALYELFKHRYPMLMMAMDRYSNRNLHLGNRQTYQDYINMVDSFHNRSLMQAVEEVISA